MRRIALSLLTTIAIYLIALYLFPWIVFVTTTTLLSLLALLIVGGAALTVWAWNQDRGYR